MGRLRRTIDGGSVGCFGDSLKKRKEGTEMEVLSFIITVIVGFIIDILCIKYNMPNAGAIVAVATMGAIILRFVRHK